MCVRVLFVCVYIRTHTLKHTHTRIYAQTNIRKHMLDKTSFVVICFQYSNNKSLECVVMFGRRTNIFT